MMLTTYINKQVPRKVRSRGQRYYWSSNVQFHQGDEWTVDATVQGTGKACRVHITREGDALLATCSCHSASRAAEVCEHIWGTIVRAELQGFLGGDNPGQPPEKLEVSSDPDALQKRLPPAWKRTLSSMRRAVERQPRLIHATLPAGHEIVYVVDVANTLAGNGLAIEVGTRHRKKDGAWSKPKAQRFSPEQINALPDPADRQALGYLLGARESYGVGYGFGYYDSAPARYHLTGAQQETLVPVLCATGRCLLRPESKEAELRLLRWDSGGVWELWLKATPGVKGKELALTAELRRGEERMPLAEPLLLVAGGLVFWDERVAPLRDFGSFSWIALFRKQGEMIIPAGQQDDFLAELFRLPTVPRLDLPDTLRFEEVRPTPGPFLKLKAPDRPLWMRRQGQDWLQAELSFDYAGRLVPAQQPGQYVYDSEQRRLLVRDPEAERAAEARLEVVGSHRKSYYGQGDRLELAPRNLPKVVRQLLQEGWRVEAEGKLYRQPGAFKIEVTSGIDWFEVHGGVSFGDQEVKLPELLAALKRGDNLVPLGDGTMGMLPEEWLKKYGLLAGLGTPKDGHLRFNRTQVGLLDALLAEQPEAQVDEQFQKARRQLQSFQGITPADPPTGFTGQLRGYQREGLGWLYFLRDFHFGGCLADDMGLGKTVQVLALLESRRERRANGSPKGRPGPSLVVVPRSLVFNWKEEAARFTPQLRVLDHTGINRAKPGAHFDQYDVILTTYGTLRRDIVALKDYLFDYAILDEAQAIKNAGSQSAKAARLLRAEHRLALSGTPVENHLGELWSLFEFLNPGMLGHASLFRLGEGSLRKPDEESRGLLAKVLRPFLLRRTKAQVAKDLPEKTEQTLYCDLEPDQRKLYDELREHYRRSLLTRIEREGIQKAKIQILEALLRLRQAACHPGLIDEKKKADSSAKLDALLPQLQEVFAEGHKTLVFSQFTSLLAIVKDRLDEEKIPYEYLDGRTRDRAARVERFQNDPDCKLFLISLKAGGLGLNLTAADYVFLLDPWWNPAVEAQAIDRTHRIGQTRPVFAYRIIARDTVEEKVLQLQQKKRALADAILSEDNSLIRDLGREDLELLLS